MLVVDVDDDEDPLPVGEEPVGSMDEEVVVAVPLNRIALFWMRIRPCQSKSR